MILKNLSVRKKITKIYKSKINDYMKDEKISLIEDLLIKFVNDKNLT